MNDNAHPATGGDAVAFRAHQGLIEAIEQAAAEEGVTRSHFARRIVAAYLRAEGYFPPEAPTNKHEAKYRPSTTN